MNKVAILAYDTSALFELSCAVELFGLERPDINNWYSTDVVTFEAGYLRSTCGVTLGVKTIDSLEDYSMLVIPSWPINKGSSNRLLEQEILKFHQQTKRIISFCSGAFLLAELGILNTRKATTHWQYSDLFKRRFTEVDYVDDVLYVLKGHIGTSAGSAAAIDLGLAIIRQDYGNLIANKIARRLVMAPHRKGGQSQYLETPVPEHASVFSDSLSWALANLNSPISINDLAMKSNMSRRTFDRRFRRIHGCSPKQWLITQRLDLAKTTLENNSEPMERVAESCGFENANALRHHFRRNLGVSPRQYRDQFSSLTNHLE